MSYYVYTLVDPRNNEVRYVGITINAEARLKQHIGEIGGNEKKVAWIKELKGQNLEPTMLVVDTADSVEQGRDRENYWIAYYLNKGIQLLNIAVSSAYYSRPKLEPEPKREIHSVLERVWEEYYSASEVCEKLDITNDTLQGWVRKRKVRRLRLPGLRNALYQRDEIDQLIS
jgi:hypothetical protein